MLEVRDRSKQRRSPRGSGRRRTAAASGSSWRDPQLDARGRVLAKQIVDLDAGR